MCGILDQDWDWISQVLQNYPTDSLFRVFVIQNGSTLDWNCRAPSIWSPAINLQNSDWCWLHYLKTSAVDSTDNCFLYCLMALCYGIGSYNHNMFVCCVIVLIPPWGRCDRDAPRGTPWVAEIAAP